MAMPNAGPGAGTLDAMRSEVLDQLAGQAAPLLFEIQSFPVGKGVLPKNEPRFALMSKPPLR